MKKNLLLLFACVFSTIQSYAASVTFISVYNGTSTNSKFTCSTPIQGSSYKFTSVNPADALFPATNNDVPGQFSYNTSEGQTITINGIILTKVGNGDSSLGFFFAETTVLGGTTTTGRSWLLILPGNENIFYNGYQASLNNSFKGSDLNMLLTAQASNVAPSINSNGGGALATVTIPENTTTVTTVTAIDSNLSSTGFSITGGTDAGKFSMNATTGELRFITAPDYENPTDAELNNTYNVRVTVTDIFGATDTQEILVTVTDTNDNSPIITSNGGGSSAIIHLVQGDNAVTTIKATDADIDDILTYSIIGGTNSSLFTINASTGLLTFKEESVLGSYEVIVQVSDNVHADTQTITVNILSTDLNQPTLIISTNDSFLSEAELSGITSYSAIFLGNITSDGGAPVSVRGFCWNTMNEPTIENSKTTNGNGIGAFTGTLLNLEANTTYYVRGYATNAVETIYSNVITFTTPKTEPTNQATGFMPEFISTTNIALKWTPAATGTQSPDGYLIKLNTNSVSSPQNGVDPDNSTVISDGSANVKVLANATLFDEFTGFSPGTMYNFSIYSFTNNGGQIKYNTSTVPTCKVATLPDEVPNASFIPTSNSTADINWALPESYNSNKQTTIVFVKAVEAIENITPTVNPLLYNSNPIFEIGTPYQGDELAYCVYKGNETSVSISDLLANTNYEVVIFNVVSESNSNGTNSYSTPVTASGKTLNSQTTALNNQPETQFPTVTIENNKIRITNITEKTTISVYNTIGRKIIEKTANNNTSEIELNISGMYLIQVQSEGLKRTTKVSVQN
jgi:hypothetical protein